MPYAEPETSGGPYPKELVGHLLLVWPTEYIDDVPSKFSRPGQLSDVIVVDLVDLDEADEFTGEMGRMARNVWWRPGKLIGALKRRVGSADPVLGWMTQGVGTQGFNAPFILQSATSDPKAVARAEEWEQRNPGFRPTARGQLSSMAPASAPEVNEPEPEKKPQREESTLERLARMAQQGAERLPPAPGGTDKIPY
jgi:hypothetical protein